MLRVVLLLGVLIPSTARAETITVFAAASLRNVMEALADKYEETEPHQITLSYAGSSALARQISFGAPADVFVSASVEWVDWLDTQSLIQPDTRFDLAGNRLVLASSTADAQIDLTQPLPAERIAMALVDAVPAGVYGKAALTSLDLWQEAQPRVVQTDNARAALALVALGEAPLGIVYATDANADPSVHVAAVFPEHSHPPIRYQAAATRGANAVADSFLAFLQTDAAVEIVTAQGFLPTGAP